MKDWIKFETDIMQHDAVRRLYAEQNLRGIGIYVIIRLYIRRFTETGLPYHEVMHYANNYASRNLVRKVLEDYGLFDFHGGMVRLIRTDAHTEACMEVGTEVGTEMGTVASTDAGEPTSEENRIEKKRDEEETTTSEEEKEWQREFREHYPTVAGMSKPLTKSEYDKLLQKYSNDRIKEKLEHMENYPNLRKRYSSTYLTLNNWLRC